MSRIGWRPTPETRAKMSANRKIAWEHDTVVIYEDWNEDAEGNIWYRWREEGEKNWHSILTPYKGKPVIRMKRLMMIKMTRWTINTQFVVIFLIFKCHSMFLVLGFSIMIIL